MDVQGKPRAEELARHRGSDGDRCKAAQVRSSARQRMSENGAGRRTSSGVRSKGSLRFLAFTFPFGESPPFFGGITSEHEPIHGVSNRGQVTIHVVVGPSVCAGPRARGNWFPGERLQHRRRRRRGLAEGRVSDASMQTATRGGSRASLLPAHHHPGVSWPVKK